MMQELSNRERLLYEAIRELGGGAISEDVLRRKTGLGHATLWAARRDLIDKGLLVVTRENRRSVFFLPAAKDERKIYHLIPDYSAPAPTTTPSCAASPSTAVPTPKRKAAAPTRQPKAFADFEPDIPRVTGDFCDLDDWTDALIAELGDVDVTPSLTSDTEYTVYAHEYQREVRYEIIETDDGISVM